MYRERESDIMRIFRKFMAALLAAMLLIGAAQPASVQAATAQSGFKGVWISFLDVQTYLKGKDQTAFDAAFKQMCSTVAAQGCNAVIVHVRSHNDAIYPSKIYPWSTTMLNGNPGFDPLADMVSIAHNAGLTFHAWINPYGYRNGVVTGNAALATNANVIAGVQEIVSNYAVDGIHFDDYFPPLGAASINSMISSVHSVCASAGKVFGIAPAGNIENCMAAGADVKTWLSTPGYVDYVCPQIYWSDNYGAAGNVTMYSNRIAAWKALDTAGIPLYVGLAAYKSGQALSYDPGWRLSSSNLASQYDKAKAAGYVGYALYRYSTLVTPSAATELAGIKAKG